MKFKRILSGLLAAAAMLGYALTPDVMPLSENVVIEANAVAGYNPDAASEYARTWAKSRNPAYTDFSSLGGDCANFVSQCLVAGGLEMTSGWYYYSSSNRSSSWAGVPGFYSYFKKAGYTIIENPSASDLKPGNPVLYWYNGKSNYGHAMIICGYDGNGNPMIAGHSSDYIGTTWRSNDAYKICTILINDGNNVGRTTLSVSAGTSTTNTYFQWTPAYNAAYYNVRIKRNGEYCDMDIWNVYGTSASKVFPVGSYEAYVDSIAATGAFIMSNVVPFTVVEGVKPAPPAPANVRAVGGSKSVTVTWGGVSGATQYRLQRKSGSSWTTVKYLTQTSYTDTGLADSTTYTYRVLAYGNGQWSVPSAAVSAKTSGPAVTGLTGTGIDKGVTLKWNAVKGAAKYRVQRYVNGAWSTVAYPSSTTFTQTGLTNGTAASYRVIAYTNGEWGTPSAGIKVRVGITVSGFSGTGINNGIVLKWNAVKGATKYRIQQVLKGSWATIAYTDKTTYTHTGLVNGTANSYRILAYVNGAWRTPSDAIKVRVGAA